MHALIQTPIPLVLTIAGLVFLFAAVFGGFGSFASLPRARQPLAGLVGIALLISGIAPFLMQPSGVSGVLTSGNGDSGILFKVDARKTWQATGYTIEQGARVRITVVSGRWTNWKGTALYQSGEGTGYICANSRPAVQCVELLPEAPTGTLIGRIGSQIFVVGQRTEIIAEQSGSLELAINDTPDGLHDNDGTLAVLIEP